jgi:hypothetical protein
MENYSVRERIYLMDYQSYTEYPDLMGRLDERPVSTARSAMNQSTPKARDHERLDYYRRFQYFSAEAVRDGCHPRIMEHEQSTQKAIVLRRYIGQ